MHAKTVGEYHSLGGTKADLKYDLDRGHAWYVTADGVRVATQTAAAATSSALVAEPAAPVAPAALDIFHEKHCYPRNGTTQYATDYAHACRAVLSFHVIYDNGETRMVPESETDQAILMYEQFCLPAAAQADATPPPS